MNKLSTAFPHLASLQVAEEHCKVLGIDLGTTNSCIAEGIWTSGADTPVNVACLEIQQTTLDAEHIDTLVPSMVAIYKGKTYIGAGAKQLRVRSSDFGLVRNRNLFYETKNDIGVNKTYHQATEGYNSAPEVGGHILRFLKQAAEKASEGEYDRVVVTVPASFQLAQRYDTLRAAELAGLNIKPGDLLDEPIAAFLDYAVNYADEPILRGESKNLLVLDFGGGTCDVAIFKLASNAGKLALQVAPLSVSRYHRLGGGDIDAAIVYEVLLPQMIAQNGLNAFELDFMAKKHIIEPALLGAAEALKINICNRIAQLKEFGKYDDANLDDVVADTPQVYTCTVRDRQLILKSPKITAKQFNKLMEPFVDPYFTVLKDTEYRLTNSMFAPISDALDRCVLDVDDIDICLLVGGSSLIPHVQEAMQDHFSNADILTYSDPELLQTAVGRGAAYHALALQVYGSGLVETIAHDAIGIRTQQGVKELVPRGATLPYPKDGVGDFGGLVVPQTVWEEPLPLQIDLISPDSGTLYFRKIWELTPPALEGESLSGKYCFDENQVLFIELFRDGLIEKNLIRAHVENPLTNVVNPNITRIRIDETEEQLRKNRVTVAQNPDVYSQLAEWYQELGQFEKAMSYLANILRTSSRKDAGIINRLGILAGRIGDHEKEVKYYTEASEASSWGGPLFNLALAYYHKGKCEAALETVGPAIDRDEDPPYYVLKSKVLTKLGRADEAKEAAEYAMEHFDEPEALSTYSLYWHGECAEMLGNKKVLAALAKERKRRNAPKSQDDEVGILPQEKGMDHQ